MEAAAPFQHEFSVPAEAIDTNGHVNNVAFVQWMQDVAIGHFRALGGTEPMRAVGGAWVVRSHQVEYLAPAFAGEVITARTWIVDVGRVRSLRKYEFWRAEKLLVRGETDWVFVNAATGRPMSIPDAITAALVQAAHLPKS